MLLIEDPIGDGVLRSRVGLAGDEGQDLAALRIHAQDAGCLEACLVEVAQQRMDRGRPGTGATADGVADADGLIEISAEGDFLEHAVKAKPAAGATPKWTSFSLRSTRARRE